MACVSKGRTYLKQSKNIRTDIKEEVQNALDRLVQLVKEAEAENKELRSQGVHSPDKRRQVVVPVAPEAQQETDLSSRLEQHTQMLLENSRKIDELKETIRQQTEAHIRQEKPSYAEVTQLRPAKRDTLHSLVVTSTDETETGDEVMQKVRQAIDAKEGWIRVERVRKAKDRKVIMGVGTKEERQRLKQRLEERARDLTVEEVTNKNPMLVLKDVLRVNSDEDILKALRNQNGDVFHGLDSDQAGITVKFRRKARNSLTEHVVLSVTPVLWQRITTRGHVHIDLQRVKAEDQSPLVQCSLCLGYGHGRRHCKTTVEKCSHCGGPHKRAECADWMAGTEPMCVNCSKAKIENMAHNAFSHECPVRKRWDSLARAAIAYC